MKVIIGLTGRLGSGKDYITNNIIIPIIQTLSKKYLHMAFADQIKINVMTKHGISYSEVFEQKTSESRQLLQNIGTYERTIDSNIWVNYIKNWIHIYNIRGIEVFILSDLRYINEFEYIKNSSEHIGILIKVIAPNRNIKRLKQESNNDDIIYNKIKSHQSECDLDNISNEHFDLIIDNDFDNYDFTKIQHNISTIILNKLN